MPSPLISGGALTTYKPTAAVWFRENEVVVNAVSDAPVDDVLPC